ncbi:MAG TPA: peptidoglycan DD-metalloendopeptidase family protein [Thermoanaerobaculia bacterium]|nr:peptidoglycan DD-metalloendopeptidase family protein [Thermoanaerobaculia bacterium]
MAHKVGDRQSCLSRRAGLPVVHIAALLIAALLAAPAEPQPSDLDRIRNDITRLRRQLENVRQQAQSAARELEEADLELGIHTRLLDLATAEEARLDREQQSLQAQVSALVPRIARQKEYLRKRLVALYRLGGLSYVRLLLTLDVGRNPIEAVSMLSYLVTHDSRAVVQFQTTQRQLSSQRTALLQRQQDLQRTRAAVEVRRREVALAVRQKQTLLARLRTQETGTESQLAALEEKARRLQRLVDALSQQQRGLAPSLDIRSVQGALAWPVEGTVVEQFGRQRNPKFSTFTSNNGLKIEAVPGTPVHAVFQGTVLFSQWFKGYGNLIILDHGNRVFSLYGNVKAPSVAVGDRVSTGQTIAGVGESEETRAGHLYFEMRRDNRPEDPQTWLR